MESLLSVIKLLFLSLHLRFSMIADTARITNVRFIIYLFTVEALQGKTCQNLQPSGVGRSLLAKISGGRGRPWGIFFGFYKTRHILLSNSENCIVLCPVVLTQYRRVTDGRTDRWTELP